MRNIMQLDEAKRILKNAGLIVEEMDEDDYSEDAIDDIDDDDDIDDLTIIDDEDIEE